MLEYDEDQSEFDDSLHVIVANKERCETMLESKLIESPSLMEGMDSRGLTAFHELCKQPWVTATSIKMFFKKSRAARLAAIGERRTKSRKADETRMNYNLDNLDEGLDGATPLHYLCMNENVTSEMIQIYSNY